MTNIVKGGEGGRLGGAFLNKFEIKLFFHKKLYEILENSQIL